MALPLDYVRDLKRWEGVVPWMYLDVHGFVTVGVGNMLPSDDAAAALPFLHLRAGRLATPDEIRHSYSAVLSLKPGMVPNFYRRAPKMDLAPAAIDDLLIRRVEGEFLPGLARLFPDFAGLPSAARAALLDMAYNLGLGGLAKFLRLRAAVRARDWTDVAAECNRATCRPERNDWCRALFLSCATSRPKQTT